MYPCGETLGILMDSWQPNYANKKYLTLSRSVEFTTDPNSSKVRFLRNGSGLDHLEPYVCETFGPK